MTPSRPSHVRRSGGIRGFLAGVGCGITPRQKSSPTPPVKPALLLRNLHIQFVIGLLQRVRVPPRGKYVSGCRIVADVLGLSENTVKGIWEMRFTHEMRKHSEAIAKRIGLIDTTEA